jgi:hypothetical protein
MIRERPPQSSVAALLEAEGLPASDLTEAHLQHFFFTGTDGTPSALVGLEIYGQRCAAALFGRQCRRTNSRLGSALVLHAEQYAAAHDVRALYLPQPRLSLSSIIEAIGASIERKPRPPSNPRVSSRAFARRAPPS